MTYDQSHNIQICMNSPGSLKQKSIHDPNSWGRVMSNITEEGLNEIRDLMESDQATDMSITANFFTASGE